VKRAAPRSFLDAQHEAAHVVVGLTLGLRLTFAKLYPLSRTEKVAETQFEGVLSADDPRFAITIAAGIAWERGIKAPGECDRVDRAMLVRAHYSRGEIRGLVRAAAAILATRGPAHARVTRLLVERDLTRADGAALMRGARA
jgi:hypothetical protein